MSAKIVHLCILYLTSGSVHMYASTTSSFQSVNFIQYVSIKYAYFESNCCHDIQLFNALKWRVKKNMNNCLSSNHYWPKNCFNTTDDNID